MIKKSINALAAAAIMSGCLGQPPKSNTVEDPQKVIGALRAEIRSTENQIQATLGRIVPINSEDEQSVKIRLLNIMLRISASCSNQAAIQAQGDETLVRKVDNPPFYNILEQACKRFDDIHDPQKREQHAECLDQERIKLLTPQQAINYFRWHLSRSKSQLRCVESDGPAQITIENIPDPTVKFTDDNFEKEISNGIVIVDFYADWCGPCKIVTPTLTQIAKQYRGRLKIGQVDVDKNPHTAERITDLGVKIKLPTIHIYENGHLIGSLSGAMQRGQLRSILLEQILKGKI